MDYHQYVNPYIAGSPVTGTEMFFGREDVFSFVRRNLIGRHRDTPIVLYGQRRTGKTSVLYQLHRHLDPRYRCIFIDLHALSLDSEASLMWGIANSISRGLKRDHQISVGTPDRATFFAEPRSVFETVFLDAVWSALGEDHLVLMIDEVIRLDEEVRAGRLELDFEYIRHLMQHFARLNFVFSIGSGLEEMKKDYAFLFSVALYHRISFLEPAAAHALITQPIRDHYQVKADAVKKILQITSGHPYYTQLVCHCMFDRWLRSPKPTMTGADVDAVLAEAIELGSANLTYVWEDSTPEEQAVMAGMAAVMGSRRRPATVDHVRKAWQKVGVSLPAGDIARAVRSLTNREVVAGERIYSFAVDLQRRWLEKHRRMDWVKEELATALQESDRSVKAGAPTSVPAAELSATDMADAKKTSAKVWIFGGASVGIVLIVVLIAVLVPGLRSTPPHAPTPSPTFSFRENFSNAASDWTVVGNGDSGRYGNGKYQIDVSPGNSNWAVATLNAPGLDPAPSNIAIEVSARPIVGVANLYYGIACRSDSSGRSDYEFQIIQGNAQLVKYVNGNTTTLASTSFTAAPANGANQLRATCTSAGSHNAVELKFWVNGTKLLDVTDSTNPIPSGIVGLIAEETSGAKSAVAAEYDNFVVTQI